MSEIRSVTRINAPPEAVFDYIDEWQNAMKYLRRVDRWRLTNPEQGTGVGAVFDIGVQAGPRRLDGKLVVTNHERPRFLAFKSMDGPLFEGSWTLTGNGEATDVVLHANYELPGGILGRIVGAFIKANAQGDIDASVRKLKQLVEAEAATG